MSYSNKVFSGLVWTFFQQFGTLFIGFIVSLVLARLLLPEDFGLIAMVLGLVSFAEILVDSGLTQSLIRSDNVTEKDYSSVFFFNIFISVLLYLLFFLLAPLIEAFYEEIKLTTITRVYCVVFIINALSAVQKARLTKELNFKTQTLITVPAKILGGLTGILLAYFGYGVWSLVWSHIAISSIHTIQIWIYSKWMPTSKFSFKIIKKHLFFGYRLTISGILNKVFSNIYLIIIGKFFNPAVLGFYTRAETMNHLAVNSISGALNKVTFPFFSKIKNDNARLKSSYKKLIKMVVFLVAPILIFSGVLADPLFIFLFTEKWSMAAPYFQILCLSGILYPIHAYNLNILKVKGRSDLYLRIAIIKKVLIVLGIAIGIKFGIQGILWAQLVLSILFMAINGYYTKIFINYGVIEQLKDISTFVVIAFLCGTAIYYLDSTVFWDTQNIIRIIVGYLVGLILYVVLISIFQYATFKEIKTILKKR